MRRSNILNPYVKGLADGADDSLHAEAVLTCTPSVERDVGMFLSSVSFMARPSSVLELGCGIGVSTRYIADGAPDADITAVDGNGIRLETARRLCAGYPNVSFVCTEAVSFLRQDECTYDMIFADCMKRIYPQIFYLAYKKLKAGGTIIFDDVFVYGYIFMQDCEIPAKYLPTVRILREFLDKIKNTYRHCILPIGGGVLVVMKQR
jgi:predicted O-methyltransferase YrrM